MYAFSHSDSKKEDAQKLGADHFVVTDPGFQKPLERELDLIISTRDAAHNFPLEQFLSYVPSMRFGDYQTA